MTWAHRENLGMPKHSFACSRPQNSDCGKSFAGGYLSCVYTGWGKASSWGSRWGFSFLRRVQVCRFCKEAKYRHEKKSEPKAVEQSHKLASTRVGTFLKSLSFFLFLFPWTLETFILSILFKCFSPWGQFSPVIPICIHIYSYSLQWFTNHLVFIVTSCCS